MSILTRSPTTVSDEGRHARDGGDSITANPYPAQSDEHATWTRGWQMPDREIEAPGPASQEQPET